MDGGHGMRSPCTHTPTHAREKSLNFFAFEQQQMGNWPINCCDALGLPISARSSTIPVPVQARTAPDVCIRAIGETTLRPLRLEKLSDKQITWQGSSRGMAQTGWHI
jgi:hypothetical protein